MLQLKLICPYWTRLAGTTSFAVALCTAHESGQVSDATETAKVCQLFFDEWYTEEALPWTAPAYIYLEYVGGKEWRYLRAQAAPGSPTDAQWEQVVTDLWNSGA